MKRDYKVLIDEYLRYFPCVALIGARQTGKTHLLNEYSKNYKIFDLENRADYFNISEDPDLFFRLNSDNVIIDEAQLLPELFPALRVAIDSKRKIKGRFIISGSSSPSLIKEISESLAGRVGIIEISPFSFNEISKPKPISFLESIISNKNLNDIIPSLEKRGEIKTAHDIWFKGGYPEQWIENDTRFTKLWMENYIKTYIERDISKLFPRLNHQKYQTFLQTLSNLSGTIINYSDISRVLGVSKPTIKDYFDIAHGTYIWRNIPSFEKDAVKRIVKHPKGIFRDSGLLHHLLRIENSDSLLSHPQMGNSWEGFVIEEIIRKLNVIGISFDYYYYRTAAGAEIDLIIEGDFGIIPIEIKYHNSYNSKHIKNLIEFIEFYKCPLGIVINNDEKPRLVKENIISIPFNFL